MPLLSLSLEKSDSSIFSTQLPKEIVVPQAVADEIVAGPENDAARLAIEAEMFYLYRFAVSSFCSFLSYLPYTQAARINIPPWVSYVSTETLHDYSS